MAEQHPKEHSGGRTGFGIQGLGDRRGVRSGGDRLPQASGCPQGPRRDGETSLLLVSKLWPLWSQAQVPEASWWTALVCVHACLMPRRWFCDSWASGWIAGTMSTLSLDKVKQERGVLVLPGLPNVRLTVHVTQAF